MATIDDLPCELLLLIFEFIHGECVSQMLGDWSKDERSRAAAHDFILSLRSLSSVDSRWRSLALCAPKLWSVVVLVDIFEDFAIRIQDFLERSRCHTLTLVINMGATKLSNALRITAESGALSRVRAMNVALHSMETYRVMSEFNFPSLQHLRCTAGVIPSRPNEWTWLQRHAATLESFEVASTRLLFLPTPTIHMSFTNLKRLYLETSDWDALQMLHGSELPVLEHLHLVHVEPSADFYVLLFLLPERMDNLRILTVEGAFDEHVIEHLLKISNKLEHFTCTAGLCGEGMLDWVAQKLTGRSGDLRLPSLKSITLRDGTMIRDNLQELMSACGSAALPNIESVDLERIRIAQFEDSETDLPLIVPSKLRLRFIDCV